MASKVGLVEGCGRGVERLKIRSEMVRLQPCPTMITASEIPKSMWTEFGWIPVPEMRTVLL